ncbi:Hpt domain-containing protein [uncultured Jannaschia sp.]|uniref:Hpt domain-containing protein n=1 Tax=uncultured Jannaschia sp. TaxID=293347 RepID=UPI00262F3DAC|nr:Hpt domain-containing protein [uncultured Jannaschia sp.]
MDDRISALLDRHHARTSVEVDAILGEVKHLARSRCGPGADLIRRVHTLKGSSGTMGYGAIFAAAERLEAALTTGGPAPDRGDLAVIVASAIDLLRARDATGVRDSSLVGKFG